MLEQWQFPVADNDASSRQNTDFFFNFFLQNSTDAAGLLLLFFLIMISKLIRLIVDCSNYNMENWVVILEELIF